MEKNKSKTILGLKKMKQGMSYSCKEKTIILNVFKYFKSEHPCLCITEIVRKTSRATGCSEKSIFQFRKEESSAEGLKEPSKTKVRKNVNTNSRDRKYDNNVRQSIRNIFYYLKCRSILPSLSTILKHVNAEPQLPDFSLMTLRRLIFDMGFYYEKNGNKSVLMERTGAVNKDNISYENVKGKAIKATEKGSGAVRKVKKEVHNAQPKHNIDSVSNVHEQKISINCIPNVQNQVMLNNFVLNHNENQVNMMGHFHSEHRPMMINQMPPPQQAPNMMQPTWIYSGSHPNVPSN